MPKCSDDCPHWHEWLKHGSFPVNHPRSHLQRGALTLKGLTFPADVGDDRRGDDFAARDAGVNRHWDTLTAGSAFDVHGSGSVHARLR